MLYLGVDLGTSSVKVGAYDMAGREVALEQRDYPMIIEQPGMCEIDPEAIVSAAMEAMRAAVQGIGGAVRAVGFSTQLYSLMAVDARIRPLTNLFTWADTRADSVREQIISRVDLAALYERTAARGEHPVCWTAKLPWLYKVQPTLFSKGNLFISIKAYLMHKLTGELFMDWSDASSTGLLNIHNFAWDEAAIADIDGLERAHLPRLVDCTKVATVLARAVAQDFSLAPDTPVVPGAGDGMCAHVGCGAFTRGAFSSTVGTTGALRVRSDTPLIDTGRRTFCFCLRENFYVAGGAINNGGLVLSYLQGLFKDQWAADQLACADDGFFALVERFAAEVPPGAEGLTFLPFLTGERAPNWNAGATATLAGLTLKHDRRHILRAAMEGVMLQLFSVYGVLMDASGGEAMIIANGGYANSPIWLSMQADIFGAPVHVSGVRQASAFGAAYIAMFASGTIASFETRLDAMTPQRTIYPGADHAAKYMEAKARYARTYRLNFG